MSGNLTLHFFFQTIFEKKYFQRFGIIAYKIDKRHKIARYFIKISKFPWLKPTHFLTDILKVFFIFRNYLTV